MKKKDNPFRMWGSWVGFLIAISYPFKFCFLFGCNKTNFWSILLKINEVNINTILAFLLAIVIYLLIIGGIGFLIGWGIHSLIRRYKK